jgi:hypothetical protein
MMSKPLTRKGTGGPIAAVLMSSNPAPPSFPPQWVVDLLPMLVAVLTGFVLAWLFSREKGEQQPLRGAKDEDAGREPPRNFTLAQLQVRSLDDFSGC